MTQQTIYPIRFGLQVPRGENLQATEILCEGGLDLTQSILENRPGYATKLINYEVDLKGGYRRIDGYNKYSNTAVTGENQLLGGAVFYPSTIIASRKDVGVAHYSTYFSTGTAWTKINTATLNYSSGMVVTNTQFNWTGTPTIVFTDGVNPAYMWDGTNYTVLNAAGSAADPTFCTTFANTLIVSGYSSNRGAIKISKILDATDWNPVDGAAEIVIGDRVTGLRPWRNQLIIFCRRSIYKITGTSTANFVLSEVTTRVGCLEGRTIQEIDGDLIFLSQDGFRTIAGTFNIGDTEIGSISRPIQSILTSINTTTTPLHSCVVERKTQYRMFLSTPNSTTIYQNTGIIGAIRRFKDGHEAWEWGQLYGFPVAFAASGFLNDNNEYAIFGGFDGFVYRMEQGNTFNGSTLNEVYSSVPFDLGDNTLRKVIHRVTLYLSADGGGASTNFSLIYDFDNSGIIQPQAVTLTNFGAGSTQWDSMNWDAFNWGPYGVNPFVRVNTQGSGFNVQAQLSGSGSTTSPSYTIQGMFIEYYPAGRR